MRWRPGLGLLILCAVTPGACGGGDDGGGAADARTSGTIDAGPGQPDAESAGPCDLCDILASCIAEACVCPDGYAGDGTSTGTGCEDLDECSAGTDDCAEGLDCFDIPGGFQCGVLFGAMPQNLEVSRPGYLARLGPLDRSILQIVPVTVATLPVSGLPALDRHPTTGTVYAVARMVDIDDVQSRALVTLDTATGVASEIGVLAERISTIAFTADGTLYGVSGNGSLTPETLFTIDVTDGSLTEVTALGAGNDGETIAFNPEDGLLYHWSGRDPLDPDDESAVMETIELAGPTVTTLTRSGYAYDEVTAATLDPAGGGFLVFNIDSEIIQVGFDGAAAGAPLGSTMEDFKGFVVSEALPPYALGPATGPAEGGTTVTLSGIGYSALTNPVVSFADAPASDVVVVDDSTITCTSPPGAQGPIEVTVSGDEGLSARYPQMFTYDAAIARAIPPGTVMRGARAKAARVTASRRPARRGAAARPADRAAH